MKFYFVMSLLIETVWSLGSLLTSCFLLDIIQSAFPLKCFPQYGLKLHKFEISAGKY